MKVVKFNYVEDINPEVIQDLLSITEYLMRNFDTYITTVDAYNMWRKLSIRYFNTDWIVFNDLEDREKNKVLYYSINLYCTLIR